MDKPNIFAIDDKKAVEALVNKAVSYIKEHGLGKAIEIFNDPDGGFQQGELYIFVSDFAGVIKAHVKPELINVDLLQSGPKYMQESIKRLIAAAKKGGGWVDYEWVNPVTNEVRAKSSYIVVFDNEYFVGAGCYAK